MWYSPHRTADYAVVNYVEILKMRKVMVKENKWIDGKNQLVEKGVAKFHQFSLESSNDGSPNPVAIIEWPDGSVACVDLVQIRFLKRLNFLSKIRNFF